jgi:predicted MarR family transcription regulator
LSTNRVIRGGGTAPNRARRRRGAAAADGRERPLFVTSSHLAVSYPELSGFEFGLIVAWHAFERWMLRCMATARGGKRDLAPLDVLVLHHTHHRGTAKRVADICFVLDVEDAHVVSYSLKKLAAAGLVRGERRGKEVHFSTTAAGAELCARYKGVRDACLVGGFGRGPAEAERLAGIAQFLRGQAAAYDQASRTAAVSLGEAAADAPARKRR